MPKTTMFDDVANDLAIWIDETATKVALALAPRVAPFSVSLTEQQKLEFYKAELFNPDGSPNAVGRDKELARLGAEGFAKIYKAVVAAHPDLKPPPVDHDSIDALAPMPQALPPGPPVPPSLPGPAAPPGPPPNVPPGIRPMAQGGVVTEPTVALIGEAGPEAVVPLQDTFQHPTQADYDQLWAEADARDQQAQAMAAFRQGERGQYPQPPAAQSGSPWTSLIAQHAGEYASDPRFLNIVAAAARAESSDNPQAYQLGYDPQNPSTWERYGGRGLWQFDIGPQGMGHGVPEAQLMDPAYQASRIVPQFADAYRRLQARPGLSDPQLAAMVYGATERPAGTYGGQWQSPQAQAYQNYLRAWNSLQGA